jgi:hypothetical protein
VVEQEPIKLATLVPVYPAKSSKPMILEAPLYNLSPTEVLTLPAPLPHPTTLANTKILLDALLGVIEAVNPVVIYVEVELVT